MEIASNYTLSHGEAVAIGMVIETRLAENLGIAEKGLTDTITQALRRLGLPTEIPTAIDRGRIIQAVGHDKKRASGQITFALPVCIGEVQTGIIVEHWEDAL